MEKLEMESNIQQQKYHVSRWKQLIFPQELIIDETHVMTRKRHFPAFWVVKEESIPLSKVASIQIIRGLFFSTVVIENSGGPFPITMKGLYNRKASEVRNLLETYERMIKEKEANSSSDPDIPGNGEKKTNKFLRFLIKPAKKAESYQPFNFDLENDEALDAWWKEPEIEEKPVKQTVNVCGIEQPIWNDLTTPTTPQKFSMLDEKIEDDILEKPHKSSWMNDLVQRPQPEKMKRQ
jgi:hypothetical protein